MLNELLIVFIPKKLKTNIHIRKQQIAMYILGVALVALCLVSVNCGTTSCLQGETFWCANEENAAKCGMTTYCATKVAPIAGDDQQINACSLCYKIYNQLHELYDAGGDMNILDMLETTLCNNQEESCGKGVAAIYERIEEFVNSEDAQSACELFEICTSNKVYIEMGQYSKMFSGLQCTGCQYIISEVKSAIGEISDEDLQKLMEQACESLDSSNEKECSTMATEYVTYVKSFIETLDGEELCTDFHMCNNDFVSLQQFREEMMQIMSESNSEVQGNNNNNNNDNNNNINACSVCKIAISVAEMQLKVINLTLTTGNYVISQLCDMFGYDFCYKVQQVIYNVQSKLSTILDPSKVCQTLNVCSGYAIHSAIMEPSVEVRQAQKIVKHFLDSFKK